MGMQDQLDSPFYCSICGEISEAVNEDDVCPDCYEDIKDEEEEMNEYFEDVMAMFEMMEDYDGAGVG